MHKEQLCNLLPTGKCNDIIITSHFDRVNLARYSSLNHTVYQYTLLQGHNNTFDYTYLAGIVPSSAWEECM
jgi:hypothetical protein